MSAVPGTTYDEVPYESHPFAQSHPNRLATVATLLGLWPPRVDRCRVLELGCASGGNLIPMALGLPDASFIGIDLSSRQIGDGEKTVAALGLKNIELKHQSILDVSADFGKFDYIIAHGIYSWVPSDVQNHILTICKQNLSPNGVAYVSYNTYPGWRMRSMIRDIMCFQARHFSDPLMRVKQARNLLDFLAKSVPQDNSPYSLLLKAELETLRQCRDSYLLHDHMEEVNEPTYFHQFAERAAAKGLRYLGEADLCTMVPSHYPREVQNVLQMLSADILDMEQYMDFLRNRMFRQTLLCHANLTPNYGLRPEQLTGLHVASPAKPAAAKPNLHSTDLEQFNGQGGLSLQSSHPIAKAGMVCLSEMWPRAVPFEELRKLARARLHAASKDDPATAAEDIRQLGECLLQCYTTSATALVELHLHPPQFALEISDRPTASPLARLQAETANQVTNLRHASVGLGEFERQILRHLDGSRDRAALVEVLTERVAQGDLRVGDNGRPGEDAARVRELVAQNLEQQLPQLARNALLVG